MNEVRWTIIWPRCFKLGHDADLSGPKGLWQMTVLLARIEGKPELLMMLAARLSIKVVTTARNVERVETVATAHLGSSVKVISITLLSTADQA